MAPSAVGGHCGTMGGNSIRMKPAQLLTEQKSTKNVVLSLTLASSLDFLFCETIEAMIVQARLGENFRYLKGKTLIHGSCSSEFSNVD